MKERPTSVTVFAIINIILCGLGVLGTIFWIINKLGLIPQPPEKDVLTLAMENSAVFQRFSDITTVVGLFTIILSLAASIAMFSLKPWSRNVTIGLGVYGVVLIITSYAIQYFVIWTPLLADVTGTDMIIVKAAMIVGGVISAIFIGYDLLMIFMLSRPVVVDAFTPAPFDNEQDAWDDEPNGGGESL